MSANVYYQPEDVGLEVVGEIDFSSGDYEYDMVVVWRRLFDGAFVYASDCGCSCPVPFEAQMVDDLERVESLAALQAMLTEQDSDAYNPSSRSLEIVALIERLHGLGLR